MEYGSVEKWLGKGVVRQYIRDEINHLCMQIYKIWTNNYDRIARLTNNLLKTILFRNYHH